jgi:thioredoxin-related protein
MKSFFICFICVFDCVFVLKAQQIGIHFETSNWKTILQKAKAENKLIFIDFHTSWCFPCKMMEKNVFTQQEVGDLYNAQFVNVKLDAEKGEAIALAKKFEAKWFPTLIFIDSNERIIYRTVGGRSVKDFMDDATIAQEELNNPMTLTEMDMLYPNKKMDSTFLKQYATKKARKELDNAEIIDEYLLSLPEERRLTKENCNLIVRTKRIIPNGVAFQMLVNHTDSVKVLLNMQKNTRSWRYMLQKMIEGNIVFAGKNKDESMLPAIIEANKRIHYEIREVFPQNADELTLYYLEESKQSEKMIAFATDYFDNRLLKSTTKEINTKDSLAFLEWLDLFKEQYKSKLETKADTLKFIQLYDKPIWRKSYTERICWTLRNTTQYILANTKDEIHLQKAMNWAKWAYENGRHFYDYAHIYAQLLFKNGFYEEAIKIEGQAAKDLGKDDHELNKIIPKTLAKMKADYAKIKLLTERPPKVKMSNPQSLN